MACCGAARGRGLGRCRRLFGGGEVPGASYLDLEQGGRPERAVPTQPSPPRCWRSLALSPRGEGNLAPADQAADGLVVGVPSPHFFSTACSSPVRFGEGRRQQQLPPHLAADTGAISLSPRGRGKSESADQPGDRLV